MFFCVSFFSVCESANSKEKRNTSIISCVSQMPFYFCKCLVFFFYFSLLRLPVFFSHSIINTLVNKEISCNNNPKTFFFSLHFLVDLSLKKQSRVWAARGFPQREEKTCRVEARARRSCVGSQTGRMHLVFFPRIYFCSV